MKHWNSQFLGNSNEAFELPNFREFKWSIWIPEFSGIQKKLVSWSPLLTNIEVLLTNNDLLIANSDVEHNKPLVRKASRDGIPCKNGSHTLFICTNVYMYACLHILNVCLFTCFSCWNVCLYASLPVCMLACLHVWMSACLFACLHVFTKDWNLYFECPLKPVHLNSRIFGNSNAACLHEIQYVCQYMCTCVSYLFVHLNSRIFGNSNVLFKHHVFSSLPSCLFDFMRACV